MKNDWLGIGVRDYIHVVDVAIGHTAAMKKFEENCGLKVRIEHCFVLYQLVLI